MQHWRWYPLTLLADGDMETSGVGNRTHVTATVTKDTDAADVFGPLGGTQSLQVITTSANGYSRETTHMKVEGSAGYYVWALVRADGAFTATIWVHDETNDSAIDDATWEHNDWGVLTLGFTTPATCDEVSIRLGAAENSATVHFNNVIVQRNGRWHYDVPSWVQAPDADIEGLYSFAGNTAGSLDLQREDIEAILADSHSINPAAISLEMGTRGVPIFLKARASFLLETAVLSANTTTSAAPIEWVTPMAIQELLDNVVGDVPGINVDDWESLRQRWLRRARAMNSRHSPTFEPEAVKVNWSR